MIRRRRCSAMCGRDDLRPSAHECAVHGAMAARSGERGDPMERHHLPEEPSTRCSGDFLNGGGATQVHISQAALRPSPAVRSDDRAICAAFTAHGRCI